ncbi:hypothetical protein B1757_05520 [Acidithiobacillus marinus]|uniref:Uncharacterized protein n=1 Tax=Acidithiobacillus marinus TaxID=187490 RepID=A0A2I1DN16_9PROT|nr:hypothetical protein [Acidithiobacillus marinus]PKY11248.1 hypothetical protein B1757_05520 [Acidithiobacillus marinus]
MTTKKLPLPNGLITIKTSEARVLNPIKTRKRVMARAAREYVTVESANYTLTSWQKDLTP